MFPSMSVDMFPITIGVETVALLSKLDVDEHIKIEIGEEELDEVEFSKKETDEEIKSH